MTPPDSSGEAPFTQERSHDLQRKRFIPTAVKKTCIISPKCLCNVLAALNKISVHKDSVVCSVAHRAAHPIPNQIDFFPPVSPQQQSFFSSTFWNWFEYYRWSDLSFQHRKGMCQREQKTQTGRHFLTSQVIRSSSQTSKNTQCTRTGGRHGDWRNQSRTHPPPDYGVK